ncbi:MAG: hypothetical protein KGO53_11660 [Alphaproteobacteria bacterium]|nr:hypothetical protein [Alphaproteobacteria bacterium]
MKVTRLLSAIVAAAYLSACTSSTIYRQSTLGDVNVLSVDAKQRLVLEGMGPDHKRVVCAEPSPDAIVASAAELAASGSAPLGSAAANARLGAAYGETAASVGVRTETIQVLRDGYFRLCEAYLNGAIGAKEYKLTLAFIDEFIVTVVAIETLGGKVVAPAVVISPQGKVTASDSTTDAANTSPGNSVTEIKVNTSGLSKDAAQAIAAILAAYYQRKAEYLKINK